MEFIACLRSTIEFLETEILDSRGIARGVISKSAINYDIVTRAIITRANNAGIDLETYITEDMHWSRVQLVLISLVFGVEYNLSLSLIEMELNIYQNIIDRYLGNAYLIESLIVKSETEKNKVVIELLSMFKTNVSNDIHCLLALQNKCKLRGLAYDDIILEEKEQMLKNYKNKVDDYLSSHRHLAIPVNARPIRAGYYREDYAGRTYYLSKGKALLVLE